MRFAILFLALSTVAFAQDAKVIALNATDAAEIKSYYDQIDALNKKIAAKKAEIAGNYTMHDADARSDGYYYCVAGNCAEHVPKDSNKRKIREFIDGWQYGFKFSDDFKFIVPLPPPACNKVLCGTTLTGDTPWVTPFSNPVITQQENQ